MSVEIFRGFDVIDSHARERGKPGTTTIGIVTLLSDRDIRAELDSGRIVLDPYDPSLIQPASVDVCLDRYYRLFDNHKYAVIDPSLEQPELTRYVEAAPGSPSSSTRASSSSPPLMSS